MAGILILAHGSRAKETEQTLDAVVNMVREMMAETLIEIAYMEFGNINIEAGIDKLVQKGVSDIRIIPYFLFEGIHIKEDIPGEIKKYTDTHDGVTVKLGKTLGEDRRLAEILKDRIEEAIN